MNLSIDQQGGTARAFCFKFCVLGDATGAYLFLTDHDDIAGGISVCSFIGCSSKK